MPKRILNQPAVSAVLVMKFNLTRLILVYFSWWKKQYSKQWIVRYLLHWNKKKRLLGQLVKTYWRSLVVLDFHHFKTLLCHSQKSPQDIIRNVNIFLFFVCHSIVLD